MAGEDDGTAGGGAGARRGGSYRPGSAHLDGSRTIKAVIKIRIGRPRNLDFSVRSACLYAALRSAMYTFSPTRPVRSNNASKLNLSILPRNRSLRRGCVRPNRSAEGAPDGR